MPKEPESTNFSFLSGQARTPVHKQTAMISILLFNSVSIPWVRRPYASTTNLEFFVNQPQPRKHLRHRDLNGLLGGGHIDTSLHITRASQLIQLAELVLEGCQRAFAVLLGPSPELLHRSIQEDADCAGAANQGGILILDEGAASQCNDRRFGSDPRL